MSLDLDAARRQDLTTSFKKTDLRRLLNGRLLMPPHPEWHLPENPTWREDPFSDRNWSFQLHMLRWLEPARRAGLKGDTAAWEFWLRWARDWASQNLDGDGQSRWAWTDMSDGIRAEIFCFAAPQISEANPELADWIEHVIHVHAEHLRADENIGNANHAMHQHEALFVVGRVLRDESLWGLALDRLGALLVEQYDEDGINAEGALAYHYNNYIWWNRTLRRVDIEGIPRPPGAERHHRAPMALAHSTRPDGSLASIGDTDTLTPLRIQSEQTDYVTSNGSSGTPPVDTHRTFNAGYVFARSGWGDSSRSFAEQTFFTLRFGPATRVHGHHDGTSITYSGGPVNWIVDPGKYSYDQDPMREFIVSRRSHSLVDLPGRTPHKRARVTLERESIGQDFQDYVLTDDSFTPIRLTRRVIWSVAGEYLVVLDHVASRRRVHAAQRWVLDPTVDSLIHERSIRLAEADRHAAIIVLDDDASLSTVSGQETPLDGWVSQRWKETTPTTVALAEKQGCTLAFTTVLATGFGQFPHARLLTPIDDDVIELEVSNGRTTEHLAISPHDVRLR